MRNLKNFKLFESSNQIDEICQRYKIENYTINSDLSISVDGDVVLEYRELNTLPLRFKEVSGNFYCTHNKLKSLDGSPISVGQNFKCGFNQLTTLNGGPKSVGWEFNCSVNKLTSLIGSPKSVNDFHCIHNQLYSFEGAPESIFGSFYCDQNPIYEVYKLFDTPKCIEWLNEYSVIQSGDVGMLDRIIWQRLMDVYSELELDIPEDLESHMSLIDGYEIIY